jgi:Etoposide-induced protein 2.4 (EI24)
MNDIARALGRALVSQFHPRMLWLAVWPFLAAFVFWGVLGYLCSTPAIDWIARTAGATVIGSWLDAGFSWIGVGGGIAFVSGLFYLGALFGLMVLTALLIIATIAMPTVVDHVSARDYPTLERKHGGTYIASVGNALWVGVLFLFGFILTIPLWLIAPLAILVPLCWWGWATARMFRYDALVEHASADERRELIARHGKAFLVIGIVVNLLNFVPPLFFLVPILGGLAFTHYGLRALERLRAERNEFVLVDATPGLRPLGREAT